MRRNRVEIECSYEDLHELRDSLDRVYGEIRRGQSRNKFTSGEAVTEYSKVDFSEGFEEVAVPKKIIHRPDGSIEYIYSSKINKK